MLRTVNRIANTGGPDVSAFPYSLLYGTPDALTKGLFGYKVSLSLFSIVH